MKEYFFLKCSSIRGNILLFSYYLPFNMLKLEKQCIKTFVVCKQTKRPTIQNINFNVSLNLQNSDPTGFKELLMFATNDAQHYPYYQDKNVNIITSSQHLVTNQCPFCLHNTNFHHYLSDQILDYLMSNFCYSSLTPHSTSLMMYIHTSLLQ